MIANYDENIQIFYDDIFFSAKIGPRANESEILLREFDPYYKTTDF